MSAALSNVRRNALSKMLETFSQNRAGNGGGIYSVCASHPLVLEAAMQQALGDKDILLIEATANQVNQFGGYTGMTPADFPGFVSGIAAEVGLPLDRIVMGGDHLGPLCWTNEPAESAMQKACDLVASYVTAGFEKIHLDASMACAGETEPLSDEVVARRAAKMCKAAEQAADQLGGKPVYVIGTEVPVPGGETEKMEELAVTTAARAKHTIDVHRREFERAGLEGAWERVIALVVQPGVEFNHTDIHAYDRKEAKALSDAVLEMPRLVYEAHSTDYQPEAAYAELVHDHFAILKVGPQLTFALREALFALAAIENEIVDESDRSGLVDVCETVMLKEPGYWQNHYPAEEPEGRTYRRFSYSDRIRYYWPHPDIETARERLFENLEQCELPLPLIHQFLPSAYKKVQQRSIENTPKALVLNHIMEVTAIYAEACNVNG